MSVPKTSSKPGQGLSTLGNLGSSLMSERAYDSDAQFVSTPKRSGRLIRSPSARLSRRLELSDLIERSLERDTSDPHLAPQNQDITSYPQSTSGVQFISTPTASTLPLQRQGRLPLLVNQPLGQPLTPLQAEYIPEGYDMSMKPARSLPDLTMRGQQNSPSFPATPATITVPRSIEDSRSLADWKKFLETNRQEHGTASFDTLPDPSTNILVKKNRQPSASIRSHTNPRSIHLDELGIPNRLASQATASGSMSCNASTPRLIHPNKYGFFVSPSQENIMPPQKPGPSAIDSLAPIPGKRDFSSFYSPQSGSIASNRSQVGSLRSLNNHSLSNLQAKENVNDEANLVKSKFALENGAVQSKFREHCESHDSEQAPSHTPPNKTDKTCPPRKVSIGWMSEGRRVGYGYSPVLDEDEIAHIEGETYYPYRKPEAVFDLKTEAMPANMNMNTQTLIDADDQDLSKGPLDSVEELIPEPNASMASNFSDINNGIMPPVSSSKMPFSTSDYPTPHYLRAILGSKTGRTKDASSVQIDGQDLKNLRAPNLAPTTHIEHCQVPKSSQYSNQANNSFTERWSRLSPSAKQGVTVSGDNADDDRLEYCNPDDQYHIQEPCSLEPSKSRSEKWARRFTRRKESRRISNYPQQDSSQTSSDPYEDCMSDSLPPTTVAEDLASMYQDCVEMPGSFDGSRWASRKSRMLWDACTEGLRHSA